MYSTSLRRTVFKTALTLLLCIASCAVDRVLYNEETRQGDIMTRVVVLDCSDMKELVITMQERGGPVRERVYRINWMPVSFSVMDMNEDGFEDVIIISTGDQEHLFYSTERGFLDLR